MSNPKYWSRSILFVGVGIHSLISLVNLYIDYPTLAGESGLIPDSPRNERILDEFEISSLVAFFPSLQYFFSAQSLIITGILASLLLIVLNSRRPYVSRFAALVIYLVLLSFSSSIGILLWFPWDCLLFELLFLTVVCPDSIWIFELLLFRVMFGFGKHKFLGATDLADFTYTSSMVCWQPLGSSIGWYLSFAPDIVHVLSILFTFLVEMICPLLIIWGSKNLKKIAFYFTIVLMIGIQLSGHFGWFNTLTSLLAVICLLNEDDKRNSGKKIGLGKKTIKFAYIFLSIIFLIPSQWNSPSLFYQHSFDHPGWDIVRTVSSWRILHSYGVFPPKKMPMIKPVARWEMDFDDLVVPLEYQYQLSGPTTNIGIHPIGVAPLRFPRFDYIYGFYAGSHVWSLVTRLGPAWGTGEEYMESVAYMLLHHPERHSQYFKKMRLPIGKVPTKVRAMVVGLSPSWEKGWVEVSTQIDREWSQTDLQQKNPFLLSPQMIVLRRRSRSFSKIDLSQENMFDLAVSRVPHHLDERTWLNQVEEEYTRISASQLICSNNCLFNIDYSTELGGYIACLTFAHLIPLRMHSGLCQKVLQENRRNRNLDDRYSKIPIPDFVYWYLDI